MMKFLIGIDYNWLFIINQNHTSALDQIMWCLSNTWIWIPFYLFIIILLYVDIRKKAIPLIILIALLIFSSDQFASGLLKPLFHRLRPSHTPEIEYTLHYVNNYKGGKYGFISSHAMNVFSLSFYLLFTLPKRLRWLCLVLFPWALLIAYSRIYLGVHFPSDVIVPFFLSIPLSYGISKLNQYVTTHYFDNTHLQKSLT